MLSSKLLNFLLINLSFGWIFFDQIEFIPYEHDLNAFFGVIFYFLEPILGVFKGLCFCQIKEEQRSYTFPVMSVLLKFEIHEVSKLI